MHHDRRSCFILLPPRDYPIEPNNIISFRGTTTPGTPTYWLARDATCKSRHWIAVLIISGTDVGGAVPRCNSKKPSQSFFSPLVSPLFSSFFLGSSFFLPSLSCSSACVLFLSHSCRVVCPKKAEKNEWEVLGGGGTMICWTASVPKPKQDPLTAGEGGRQRPSAMALTFGQKTAQAFMSSPQEEPHPVAGVKGDTFNCR